MKVILLVGLPQVLVVLLSFLLEELQSPGERLVLGAVLCALVDGGLCVLVQGLELLDLLLEHAVLVLQGSDLLLLLKVLLLERLDSGGKLLDLGGGLVGLESEGVHALGKEKGMSDMRTLQRERRFFVRHVAGRKPVRCPKRAWETEG